LEDFVSTFGRRFYQRELHVEQTVKVVIRKIGTYVVEDRYGVGEECVVPFWAGKKINWQIVSN